MGNLFSRIQLSLILAKSSYRLLCTFSTFSTRETVFQTSGISIRDEFAEQRPEA